MRAQVSFVLSECTRLTDKRTDRRTEMPWKYRALHYEHVRTCSRMVKKNIDVP